MSGARTESRFVAPAGWLPGVEALRAIAFVFIVLGHAISVMAEVATDPVSAAWLGTVLALTRFALPGFMAVSALLIARRVEAGKPVGVATSLGRLFVPYVLWTLFYVLFGQALQGGEALTAEQLVGAVVRALATGTGYYHLWYMVIALQVVIVAPVLAKAFGRLSAGGRRWAVVLTAAANMVLLGLLWGPLLDSGPVPSAVFGLAADRIVIFWIAYVVLGAVLGLDYERSRRFLARARPLLLLLYVLSACALAWIVWRQSIATGGDFAATAEISRVMQAWILPFELLSIVVWLDLGGLLARTPLASWLRVLASASFGGYLIHPLWLTIGSSMILERFPSPPALPTVVSLTLFALLASVASSWLIGRARSPLGEALVGRQLARPVSAEAPKEPEPEQDDDA